MRLVFTQTRYGGKVEPVPLLNGYHGIVMRRRPIPHDDFLAGGSVVKFLVAA
jgi:hypothetical protein